MCDIWEDFSQKELYDLEENLKSKKIIAVDYYHDYAVFKLDNGWQIEGVIYFTNNKETKS